MVSVSIFKGEGFEVKFIGTGKNEYISKEGYPAKADLDIENINSKNYDAVIVPGGYAPDILKRYDKINKLDERRLFNYRSQ